MAAKTSFVRTRIEPDIKLKAENILNRLGITPTQAVTMLYKKVIRDHEWPLELKIPNEETQKIMEETDKGIGVVKCKNIKDLFEQLGL
jgi:DNA-damage-inducible protein J